MVNGTPIGSLQGLATRLASGDTIAVFPIMGGG
jgi:molybdopterin converting factor small subunit